VRIGCYAHLGIGVNVLPMAVIGEGAVVGAGAVVLAEIPAWVTAVVFRRGCWHGASIEGYEPHPLVSAAHGRTETAYVGEAFASNWLSTVGRILRLSSGSLRRGLGCQRWLWAVDCRDAPRASLARVGRATKCCARR